MRSDNLRRAKDEPKKLLNLCEQSSVHQAAEMWLSPCRQKPAQTNNEKQAYFDGIDQNTN